MQKAQVVTFDNRPFVLILRLMALAGLLCSLWSSTLVSDATAAPKLNENATYGFPPCGGIAFNIAIESMGADRVEKLKCTFEMDQDQPVFKFEGDAQCQNAQIAFSGKASIESNTIFHAHLTCSRETDPLSVFDSVSCPDKSAHVVFIVNGRNAQNIDLTCDYQLPDQPRIVLAPTDFAGICATECPNELFVANSWGTNWYLNANCDGVFTVPETMTLNGITTRIGLTWFDKDGLPSRIQSGDKNPTAQGVCIAYLEPLAA